MKPVYKITLLASLLASSTAMRSVPKWQAFGDEPLKSVVECTSSVFGRFGKATRQWGEKPEEGRVRIFLVSRTQPTRPLLTAFLDGEGKFTAIWMDAIDDKLAALVWDRVIKQCGVH